MLLDFYKQTKPATETNFFNTTMQLNRNYSARLHVDKNNHGPSYIIALGEYQGGRLWCYDKVRHDFVVASVPMPVSVPMLVLIPVPVPMPVPILLSCPLICFHFLSFCFLFLSFCFHSLSFCFHSLFAFISFHFAFIPFHFAFIPFVCVCACGGTELWI